MLAAGLVCTPPSSSARLPPIRSSFRTPPSHTPTTTAQHTLYYSISPGASTESRFNTLRRQDTTTQRRPELGTGGGKGIAVSPDVDMHPVRADDGDVRKERRGLVAVPGTEDGEDNASEGEYSDDDSTQGSEYSDEGEGADEFLAAFSDPGHYTYTDRIHPGPTPTVNAGAAARVRDAPPPKQEHLRPSASTPLSAREYTHPLHLFPPPAHSICLRFPPYRLHICRACFTFPPPAHSRNRVTVHASVHCKRAPAADPYTQQGSS